MVKPVELTSEPQFKAIRRNAVAQSAIATIKEMIVTVSSAGQRLPAERDLAAQLELSPADAARGHSGADRAQHPREQARRGNLRQSRPELLSEPIDFVLQVNDDALLSLFEARRVLEAGVAALAAERAQTSSSPSSTTS